MERRKRDSISRRITEKEWRQHFMSLLHEKGKKNNDTGR